MYAARASAASAASAASTEEDRLASPAPAAPAAPSCALATPPPSAVLFLFWLVIVRELPRVLVLVQVGARRSLGALLLSPLAALLLGHEAPPQTYSSKVTHNEGEKEEE